MVHPAALSANHSPDKDAARHQVAASQNTTHLEFAPNTTNDSAGKTTRQSLPVDPQEDVLEALDSLRDYFRRVPSDDTSPHQLLNSIPTHGALAVPFLIDVLTDKSELTILRQYSVMLLDRIHDPSSLRALSDVASDPAEDEKIRILAIGALSRFKDLRAAATIADIAVQASSRRVSDFALRALANFPVTSSTSALRQALNSEDYITKKAAAEALRQIIIQGTSETVTSAASGALEDAGYQIVDELQHQAEQDPVTAGTDFYEFARETVHSIGFAQTSNAVAILGAIYRQSDDERLRQHSIAALGGFNASAEATQILQTALTDDTPKVRMVAARSLLLATNGAASPIIEQAITDESDENVRRDMRRALRFTPTE
jgi:HEAT repeat protein